MSPVVLANFASKEVGKPTPYLLPAKSAGPTGILMFRSFPYLNANRSVPSHWLGNLPELLAASHYRRNEATHLVIL